ncbi:hypothetical protein NQ317_006387 [Molorchus minor]|uniref:Uncharacterized protein n=1 Tax=Molorchus minor TaxID=1323400 RepID=A0ABQ9ITA3_9CUCU|nr:hypothetical protein NQ317_006387 [Molorchus minor]
MLNKALQKPQKAGQHFHQHYKGLLVLIDKYMTIEKSQFFFEKVQKFEVAEVFHAKLLEAICNNIFKSDVNNKTIYNIVLTFVHIQMILFKRNNPSRRRQFKTKKYSLNILEKVILKAADEDLTNISQNETIKLYIKLCLKFGISGEPTLLKILANLVNILAKSMDKEDGRLILEMMLSHSEFLNYVLGEHSDIKLGILSLFLVLCKNWSEFMERNHIPVLLAAYRSMVNRCDRIILSMLKLYEAKAGQTSFYDFKPYLWGKSAASHYSVRLNIETALWRQPKMGDVLDILQDEFVLLTIKNYPLKEKLQLAESEVFEIAEEKVQLLAPEQQVQTYKFTRSGALSLTVVGLSSSDIEVRQAACHVLSRFNYHMDARQSGKDNLLWLRYVEAVCKGWIEDRVTLMGLLRSMAFKLFSELYSSSIIRLGHKVARF